MNKMKKLSIVSLTATALMTTVAFAQAPFTASAVTDLNIRSGPGPQFPIIGVIEAGDSASVEGCTDTGSWCQVNYQNSAGWAFANYLTTEVTGTAAVISEIPRDRYVRTIPTETRAEDIAEGAVTGGIGGAAAGAIGGAIAGTLVGGPIGAAAGAAIGAGVGVAGGAVGEAVTPPNEVDVYVREQPAQTVLLNGEVVVGAQVPETVALQPVPQYRYQYVNINGQPVLVEPSSRQIVYVYR